MPALEEFRENAARAVFITGVIDEHLVQRLTPDICRLRGESDGPITVYINSSGGSTLCAEQLRALLSAPNQEGRVCRIITVATSRADSAAADLLALGDYAIAYPAAVIHCHGSRLAEQEITSEFAEVLAASLKQSNNDYALRLAHRTFARVVFHFVNLRSEFAGIRQRAAAQSERATLTDLECFAVAICSRLSSGFEDLPSRAIFQHKRLAEIAHFVFNQPTRLLTGESLARTEAELLKRLIEYELTHKNLSTWSLSEGGIDDVAQDFKSLSDYLFGPYRDALEDHLNSLGVLFLDPTEMAEYRNRHSIDPSAAREWLRARAEPLIELMWYFVVSLCRLLQSGEYGLTSTDAYWLGIVDEVIGASLPSFRLIAENPIVNPT